MKATVFFLFCFNFLQSYAQEVAVSGTVYSSSKEPMAGAVVIDEKGNLLSDTTDVSGRFFFEAEVGSRFAVEKKGFELAWRTVRSELTDYSVTLDVEVVVFESVVITRRNSEEVLDLKNVNIIHYQPLNEAILTLKKEKRTYYLGLDSLNKEGIRFLLAIDRPNAFFFDCFQNAYVLSADSAYQFVLLDSGLIMLPGIEMTLFNQYIRPCVSKFEDRLVMEQITSLNKEYDLVMYDQEQPRNIFHIRDDIGYQAAFEASINVGRMVDPNDGDTLVDPVYLCRKQRREVYGRNDTGEDFQRALAQQRQEEDFVNSEANATYHSSDSLTPLVRGARPFGSQDAWRSSRNSALAMASYKLFTQPIHVKTFQIGGFMAVVDYDSSIVHILDHYGYPIKKVTFSLSSDIKDVMQDKATGYLYLYTRDKGNHKVYGLDAFTGRVSYLKNFGGMPHTEQAIIYDGYLYYKVLERDFYVINRVQLPKMSFFEAD